LLFAIGMAIAMAGPASAQIAFDPIVNVSQSPGDSRQPHLALDGSGALHVAWADDSGNPGIYKIRYARSFDGGRTFSGAIDISSGDTASLRPRIATFGQSVYLVWMQDGAGDQKDAMFARSVDGGASFSAPINLSNSAGESLEARIAVTPTGVIVVVWDEGSPSRHIAIARSSDGGASFEAPRSIAAVASPPGCPPGGVGNCETVYPGVAIDRGNGNVYVVWHDRIGTQPQVLFSRSTDGGTTFTSPKNISNAPVHAHCASISVGFSGKILVAYESRKDLTDHKHDATFVQSADQGSTFSTPVNLSNGPSWALSDYPWATEAPDGTIIVGWEDNAASGGDLDAVIAVSRDGGATFSPPQDVSNNPDTLSTEVVTLFGPDGTLYMVWEDYQSGQAEVFLTRAGGAGGGGGGLVGVGLGANKGSFVAGEVLTLSVTAQNPGAAQLVDVYFGVLLPAAMGPSLGCPNGDALVLQADRFARAVTTCLSRVPENTPALLQNVEVPAGMPVTTFTDVFGFQWTPDMVRGTYVFFIAVTRAGAFNDGSVDPGDVVSISSQTVTFQ
jgi:hypothetical protein